MPDLALPTAAEWVAQSHQLAEQVAYSLQPDSTLSPAYIDTARQLVQRQVSGFCCPFANPQMSVERSCFVDAELMICRSHWAATAWLSCSTMCLIPQTDKLWIETVLSNNVYTTAFSLSSHQTRKLHMALTANGTDWVGW